jgi:hypothetical protein
MSLPINTDSEFQIPINVVEYAVVEMTTTPSVIILNNLPEINNEIIDIPNNINQNIVNIYNNPVILNWNNN